ncbi:MAG: protein kinase [Kofleriaceae bacterium]
MSAAHKALPRPCPTCGELGSGVFCPQDGTPLEGAFSLGGERYVVEELIGNGAMAIVFGGTHRTLARPVAVKILRPDVAQNSEHQQRFLREARSASQLTHENIVGVLDFGWDDALGVTYLVMERLFGQSLAASLGHGSRIEWPDVVPLLVQITRALVVAHGVGIVHRDLTSRNVILVEVAGRRVAKLCDFGLSRHTAGGDRVTQHGASVGTPAYTAPEQLAGGGVEASADLYGLGVLAYEMLTGHLPGPSPEVISSAFPDLGVPEELASIVSRCLAQDPLVRPTAAALERMLVRIEARVTSAGVTPLASAASGPTYANLDEGVPTMIGSYRVVRALGAGGTGRVYLGEHPVIGTKVAIKVLLPEIAGSRETVERFIQEARSSSQIESPHIPRYFDFGRTAGGLPYAVMEYFEGETLADRIVRAGALSVDESADILGQVASALHLAHQAGLVHRDLKPENIFLATTDAKSARGTGEPPPAGAEAEQGFNVKVLDFGIAKTFGKESGTRTQQGFFLGTPFYCAPEQVFGAEVDPRTDVYGLGATAFEMLTGLPPFVGEISEVLEAKTSQEAPLLRTQRADVPAHVERTVARMLARDPAARAVSMTWVQEQISTWCAPAAAAEAEPVEVAPPARASSPSPTRASSPSPARIEGPERSGRAPASAPTEASSAAEVVSLLAPRRRAPSRAASAPGRITNPGEDSDFDAADTVALLPAAPERFAPSALAAVEVPPPPRASRRAPALALAAGLAVAAGLVAYLVLGGDGGGAPAPKVSPIVEAAPAAHGPSGEGAEGGEGSAAASAVAAEVPGAPPTQADDEPDDEQDDELEGGSAAPRVRSSRGSSRHNAKRDRRSRSKTDPNSGGKVVKDPEPPKDVNLVNPFQ